MVLLGIGWLVYDALSRVLERNDRLLTAAIAVVIAVTAFGVSSHAARVTG